MIDMDDRNFKSKQFILTHVLYEMMMYLWSHKCLNQITLNPLCLNDTLCLNGIRITHEVTLRNLIEFYEMVDNNCKKDDDVLYSNFTNHRTINKYDFSKYFKNSCFDCKKQFDNKKQQNININNFINKSIHHITEARFFVKNGSQHHIDTIIYKGQENIFPIMRENIKNFIEDLENKKIVSYCNKKSDSCFNILNELNEDSIKEEIKIIKCFL